MPQQESHSRYQATIATQSTESLNYWPPGASLPLNRSQGSVTPTSRPMMAPPVWKLQQSDKVRLNQFFHHKRRFKIKSKNSCNVWMYWKIQWVLLVCCLVASIQGEGEADILEGEAWDGAFPNETLSVMKAAATKAWLCCNETKPVEVVDVILLLHWLHAASCNSVFVCKLTKTKILFY